uniref:Ufm1-specific protease 2 n=1 Tax=Elaeophora elaphi TaxID=1147741 RepID=A0A0R3S4P1_9BILA
MSSLGLAWIFYVLSVLWRESIQLYVGMNYFADKLLYSANGSRTFHMAFDNILSTHHTSGSSSSRLGTSLDVENRFRPFNYSNSHRYQGNETVAALLFGNASLADITNVLFGCLSDFDTALDLIRFIESSLPSNITFLGVLSFISVEYPFDLNTLAVSMEDTEGFIVLFTDIVSLETRDVDSIIKLNKDIDLRPSLMRLGHGLLVRTSLCLNVNINMSEKGNLHEEISNAFIAELDNIESFCFVISNNSFVLGGSKVIDAKQLSEGLLQISGYLSSGRKFVNFTPLIPIKKDSHDSLSKLVPIVKIRKAVGMKELVVDLAVFCNMRIKITSVAEVQSSDGAPEILTLLRRALKRTVHLTERCLCEFVDFNSERLINIRCGVFSTNDGLLSVVYPVIQDDMMLRNYRAKLHRIFNLPSDRPILKPAQSLQFNPGMQKLLQNPHLHIRSYKPKGKVYIDGINDSGWGCAYRSFQTLWSWFVLQGYIDKPTPTHCEIQQSLYDCGDKDATFVGSQRWIGSIELGYCLENMAGIESRVLTTNSGAEVTGNIRQLALHFKTCGTPVMIGGGMLAHTILGVDFNESTGESSFLVLDPHYCGDEDLHTVVTKGWCGWKTPSFWKQEYFYNLLLPIPPQNVI